MAALAELLSEVTSGEGDKNGAIERLIRSIKLIPAVADESHHIMLMDRTLIHYSLSGLGARRLMLLERRIYFRCNLGWFTESH